MYTQFVTLVTKWTKKLQRKQPSLQTRLKPLSRLKLGKAFYNVRKLNVCFFCYIHSHSYISNAIPQEKVLKFLWLFYRKCLFLISSNHTFNPKFQHQLLPFEKPPLPYFKPPHLTTPRHVQLFAVFFVQYQRF